MRMMVGIDNDFLAEMIDPPTIPSRPISPDPYVLLPFFALLGAAFGLCCVIAQIIPVSVIVTTRNKSENIAHCLLPLVGLFQRVIVVDSNSTDDTVAVAKSLGADVIGFNWNGTSQKAPVVP